MTRRSRHWSGDACEVLGKEAAVYMPSGTMTNQVAICAHTEPGDEIVLDAGAAYYYYEAGAPAALSGVMVRLSTGIAGFSPPSSSGGASAGECTPSSHATGVHREHAQSRRR